MFPGISGVSQKSQIVIGRPSRIEEVLGKELITECVPTADHHDDTPIRENLVTSISKNFLNSTSPATYYLRFVRDTRDPREENNLYPFLHLLRGGNLYLRQQRSISLDYTQNRIVEGFPVIPGEDSRTYPAQDRR